MFCWRALNAVIMCSLYDLALRQMCLTIDCCNEGIVKKLPPVMRRDLCKLAKHVWMFEVVVDLRDVEHYEYRFLDFFDLDKQKFIMLMNHPENEYPRFLANDYEKIHVYQNYYKFESTNLLSPLLLLCRNCFLDISTADNDDDMDFFYKDYWARNGWRFFIITKHEESTSGRKVICDIVKNRQCWCDNCVLQPLFELHNNTQCKEFTHMHDLEDDTDSDISSVFMSEEVEIFNPYYH